VYTFVEGIVRETAQQKKDQLLSGLLEVRRQILDLAGALPLEKQNVAYLGEWDIYGMLAHLAGWDFTNIQAVEQIRSGSMPEFYQYASPDWRAYNAQLVAKYRMDELDTLVNFVRATQQTLLKIITALQPEELYKDRGIRIRGYKITIARLLEAELKDERVHLAQLEAFAAS
jgi:hypothetical protein